MIFSRLRAKVTAGWWCLVKRKVTFAKNVRRCSGHIPKLSDTKARLVIQNMKWKKKTNMQPDLGVMLQGIAPALLICLLAQLPAGWCGASSQMQDNVPCPCNECGHETMALCIKNDCKCCALEDGFFLLTGSDVRKPWFQKKLLVAAT